MAHPTCLFSFEAAPRPSVAFSSEDEDVTGSSTGSGPEAPFGIHGPEGPKTSLHRNKVLSASRRTKKSNKSPTHPDINSCSWKTNQNKTEFCSTFAYSDSKSEKKMAPASFSASTACWRCREDRSCTLPAIFRQQNPWHRPKLRPNNIEPPKKNTKNQNKNFKNHPNKDHIKTTSQETNRILARRLKSSFSCTTSCRARRLALASSSKASRRDTFTASDGHNEKRTDFRIQIQTHVAKKGKKQCFV